MKILDSNWPLPVPCLQSLACSAICLLLFSFLLFLRRVQFCEYIVVDPDEGCFSATVLSGLSGLSGQATLEPLPLISLTNYAVLSDLSWS